MGEKMRHSKVFLEEQCAAVELVRRLNAVVGKTFCCTECGVSITQLLLAHLCDAHNYVSLSIDDVCQPTSKREHDVASSIERERVDEDERRNKKETKHPKRKKKSTIEKPLQLFVSDFVDIDVDQEKVSIARVLDEISAGLPEVSLESHLELQHTDEPATCPPEDGLRRDLCALEKFCDDVEAVCSEAPAEEAFVSLPEDKEDRTVGAFDDQDASEWVGFVENLRDRTAENPHPKVDSRVIELKERYTCSVCHWKLPKRALLFRHMQKHWDIGLKFCHDCGKLAEITGGNANCVDCLTKEREALMKVERKKKEAKYKILMPEPPSKKKPLGHRCGVCRDRFPNKASAKLHEKSHEGVPYFECPHCNVLFRTEEDLAGHMKIKCDEEETKRGPSYECSQCSRTFNKRANYLRHIDIHNGIRYCCKFCSRSYTQEYQLKCHESKHTGRPKFQCRICQKTFVEPSTYSRHKKMHKRTVGSAEISGEFAQHSESVESLTMDILEEDVDKDPLELSITEDAEPHEFKPDIGPPMVVPANIRPARRIPAKGTTSTNTQPRPLRPIVPVPPEVENPGSVEVILCRSIPSGRGEPSTLVANSYKATPDGAHGYRALESQVIVENIQGSRNFEDEEGNEEIASILGPDGASADSLQPVQIEYNGKLYPAYLI